jgi:hypothetical protein
MTSPWSESVCVTVALVVIGDESSSRTRAFHENPEDLKTSTTRCSSGSAASHFRELA